MDGAPATAPPAPAVSADRRGYVVAAAGAMLAVVGVFLPWLTVVGFPSISVAGIDTDDGKIMLVASLIVAAVASLGVANADFRSSVLLAVLTVALAAFAVFEASDVSRALAGSRRTPDWLSYLQHGYPSHG